MSMRQGPITVQHCLQTSSASELVKFVDFMVKAGPDRHGHDKSFLPHPIDQVPSAPAQPKGIQLSDMICSSSEIDESSSVNFIMLMIFILPVLSRFQRKASGIQRMGASPRSAEACAQRGSKSSSSLQSLTWLFGRSWKNMFYSIMPTL